MLPPTLSRRAFGYAARLQTGEEEDGMDEGEYPQPSH